jgi:protein-tyrosine phosphatase
LKSILFVCTGNIFRSMTAEYALKAALGPQPMYHVGSAGTEGTPQAMSPVVIERLLARDIDPAQHQSRKLTAEILSRADLAIAMGLDHRTYLKDQFDYEAVLFNQVCFGKAEPVLDIWQAVPNWQNDVEARKAYAISIVDYICDSMPAFVANVECYMAR